mgnify:CR=1 FL=1
MLCALIYGFFVIKHDDQEVGGDPFYTDKQLRQMEAAKAERTTMTDFTPETPVLTPIRDHAAELAKAEAGVAEMAAKRNNRWYPKYHIASNGGWINDPNGLCFYKGRWHVFYQLHPYGTQWGPMHWGHVSSTDMLNWKREPIHVRAVLRAGEGRRVLRFCRHRRQRRPSLLLHRPPLGQRPRQHRRRLAGADDRAAGQ